MVDMNTGLTMTDLVRTMVKAVVDKPGEVHVDLNDVTLGDSPKASLLLRVRVTPADLGKVIGKHGRTARAMRTILMCAGLTSGVMCEMSIDEPPAAPAVRR